MNKTKALVTTGLLSLPGIAMADGFTITAPTFDYAQLGTYAGTILTALAAIWLVRKLS